MHITCSVLVSVETKFNIDLNVRLFPCLWKSMHANIPWSGCREDLAPAVSSYIPSSPTSDRENEKKLPLKHAKPPGEGDPWWCVLSPRNAVSQLRTLGESVVEILSPLHLHTAVNERKMETVNSKVLKPCGVGCKQSNLNQIQKYRTNQHCCHTQLQLGTNDIPVPYNPELLSDTVTSLYLR